MQWPWERLKVFVCHIPGDPQREKWLKQVTDAWYGLNCWVKVLSPSTESPLEFQRTRRIKADEQGGGIYVLADDDCLPVAPEDPSEPFTSGMVSTLKKYPEFAILAPLPQNENIVDWTPSEKLDKYRATNDKVVMEHVSVGGIRFCRKGAMKEWPKMGDWGGYDGIQGAYLREEGFRVGYVRRFRFYHLGAGKSTVWTND